MSRPTVAVGVGAGGARMLAALADRVGANGAATDAGDAPGWTDEPELDTGGFRFLALDTDRSDLRTEAPAAAETLALGPPNGDVTDRPYLAAPPASTEEGSGLRRRRALARLALESSGNLDTVRTALDDALDDLTGDAADGVDVWLLAGLSGGVGGGSLPLLAALVADIAEDAAVPVSTYVFGGLPATDGEETTAIHARNAYVATRELLALLPGSDIDYPVRFRLPVAEAALGRDALTIDEPPLSGVFLASVAAEGRVAPVDRAAATTVAGHAHTEGRQDLPFDNGTFGREPGPPAYVASAGGVALPTADLERLFTARADRRATDDQLAEVRERIDDLADVLDWLTALLAADLDAERPGADAVDDAVFHYPGRRASDADLDGLATGDLEIATHVDSVVSEVGRAVPERVPTRSVVALVLAARLADRIGGAIESHAFRTTLRETRTEYADAVDEVVGEGGVPSDPEALWREAVEPALANRAASLSAEAEDRLNPIASRRLSKQAEAANRRAADLAELAAAYGSLTEVRERARERAAAARETLRERRDELETEADAARRERDRLAEERRELTRQRDAIRESLRDPDPTDDGVRRLPVANVADLIPETLSFADSLAELVVEGFLDEATVADELAGAVGTLGDTVHDPAAALGTDSRLVMSTARANRWGPAGDLLTLDPAGGTDVQSVLAEGFDDRIGVDDQRGFAIDFVGLYAPLSLAEAGVLGELDRAFGDPARDASEVFGDLSDASVRDAMAYPELAPEDSQGADQREVADAIAEVEAEGGVGTGRNPGDDRLDDGE
jgi:hypothetical protein